MHSKTCKKEPSLIDSRLKLSTTLQTRSCIILPKCRASIYLLNSLFKILFGVFVLVKFYPWFQCYFPLFVKSLSYIYHTPKQKKIKLKPKIKLNCNIFLCKGQDHQSLHNSSRHVQDPSQTVLM